MVWTIGFNGVIRIVGVSNILQLKARGEDVRVHVCRWPGPSSPPTAPQWSKHIFITRTAALQKVSPGLNHGRWNHSFRHIQSLFFLPRSPCVSFQKHVFYCLPVPSHLLHGPFLQVINSIMEPQKLIGPRTGRNCCFLSMDSSPLVHIN